VLKKLNSPTSSYYRHHVWQCDALFLNWGSDVAGCTFSIKFLNCLISPQSFMLFLIRRCFHPGTLSWYPVFLPTSDPETMTVTQQSEICSATDVVLGTFVTSWMNH
ncbi:hypothetical protein ATANTOWER_027173, partial [Ataeniobius toweri]|nr:hypothetical protein [Ataeniobius toweri]